MDKNEDINIVFSSDNNYSKYTGVAICSIFENKTTEKNINIFILDGGINETNKEKLINISKKYNFYLEFKKVSNEKIKKLKTTGHITHPTYYRIMIPEIFPNLNKVLYLDCDILVTGDLLDLYLIDIEKYFIAACDEEDYIKGRLEILEIPNHKYFNAGVLLINLKKWRKENLSKKLINHALENLHKFDMHDQDILNSFLYDKWIEMPYKYNYTSWFLDLHPIKNIKDVSIIHYTGLKPWNYDCLNPLKKEYFKYLKLTPWGEDNFYIDKNYKKIIVKLIKIILLTILPKKISYKIRKIRYFIKIKKIR